MVIKFYISSTSGNKEMKKRQMKSQLIMESKGVRFEVIDISDPASQHEKTYMQRNAIPKPGARNAIPPQFFNDEPFESDNPYCGDYEGFDEAVETDTVEEFLKLPRGSLPQVPIIIHNLSNPNSREVSMEKEPEPVPPLTNGNDHERNGEEEPEAKEPTPEPVVEEEEEEEEDESLHDDLMEMSTTVATAERFTEFSYKQLPGEAEV